MLGAEGVAESSRKAPFARIQHGMRARQAGRVAHQPVAGLGGVEQAEGPRGEIAEALRLFPSDSPGRARAERILRRMKEREEKGRADDTGE